MKAHIELQGRVQRGRVLGDRAELLAAGDVRALLLRVRLAGLLPDRGDIETGGDGVLKFGKPRFA